MKKILVPTDFSPSAQVALQRAFQIAKKHEAEVDVLHVIGSLKSQLLAPEVGYFDEDLERDYIASIQEHAFALIQKNIESISFKEAQYKVAVETGNIYQVIKQYAAQNDIDLILMGTEGTRNLKEIWVGSNTEKVVRVAPCPVLAVKPNCPEFEGFANVLFPSSLSEAQAPTLKRLAQFVNNFGGKIHLLYVNTAFGYLDAEEIVEKQEAFIRKAGLEGIAMHHTTARTEEAGILNMARYLKVDLIALQTSQRKGLAHFFFGSTAEDVVNAAQIPVLTFGVNP